VKDELNERTFPVWGFPWRLGLPTSFALLALPASVAAVALLGYRIRQGRCFLKLETFFHQVISYSAIGVPPLIKAARALNHDSFLARTSLLPKMPAGKNNSAGWRR
jgi:hypothetical protein